MTLTVPSYLRGNMRHQPLQVRKERNEWIKRLIADGHSRPEIADALGITKVAVGYALRAAGAPFAADGSRTFDLPRYGIGLGHIGPIFDALPKSVRAVAVDRAAKRNMTLAEVMVDHFASTCGGLDEKP